MIILVFIVLGNILYSNKSLIDTKEGIKEIKIGKKINSDSLIKDKEIAKFTRTENITSRSVVNRTNKEEKKKENNEENKEEKYIKPKDVKISKNMDLSKRTGMSKEDFKKVIKNVKQDRKKFFYENADIIYDLCEKYQINEIFFCGLIVAESGWDIASNHRNTHNYISLMHKGKLIRYSSTKKGLEVAARKLHENYLTPGGKFYNGKTILGVQKRFCPASDTWDDLVYGAMKYVLAATKKVK